MMSERLDRIRMKAEQAGYICAAGIMLSGEENRINIFRGNGSGGHKLIVTFYDNLESETAAEMLLNSIKEKGIAKT